MPVVGTNIASSVAGVTNAERAAAKPPPRKEPAKASRRPSADELIVSTDAAEATEGVRSLKSNDQEEAHEDRDQQTTYTPGGRPKDVPRPRLDIAG